MMIRHALVSLMLLLSPSGAQAGEVTVAVAANFLTTAQALAPLFLDQTGHKVLLVSGSSGRLSAQISAGAPYDVFLSADAQRPNELLAANRAIQIAPYAIGRLILAGPADMAQTWEEALAEATKSPIAIANPALAPYGVAAEQVLRGAGYDPDTLDLIRGDSVGQVAAFLATGNVRYGFVALSQAKGALAGQGTFIEAPRTDADLTQWAALLNDRPETRLFFDWLISAEAAPLIAAAGYHLPERSQ